MSAITANAIATKAALLVAGDRAKTHGDKLVNHACIAAVVNGYMAARRVVGRPIEIDAEDFANIMECMKIARRLTGGFNPDDYIDGAGYAAVAGEIRARLINADASWAESKLRESDIGLIYLATPYTKYKGGDLRRAFVDASKLAAKLLTRGYKVYSPIAHTHPLAIHGELDPLDHDIWLAFDEAMMEAADCLVVARMEGWDKSRGIAHEIEFFADKGKPIYDLDPATLVMTMRG